MTLAAAREEPNPGEARAPVVLVRGTFTEKEDPEGEGLAAARAFSVLEQAFDLAGVSAEGASDEAVAAGALEGRRVAVLAYCPQLAPGEIEALKGFVESGGRLLVFYSADRALWAGLGIGSARVRPRARPDEFAEMAFEPGALRFAPPAVTQNSWNIIEVAPAPGAIVLARWRDGAGGKVENAPAVVRGPEGVIVTHILLGPVTAAKARMLLALCAELGGPAVLEPAARVRLAAARGVGSLQGLGGLAELARALRDPRVDRDGLTAALEVAARAERDAFEALEMGAYASAYEQALAAERSARDAAALALPPRDGEVRAIWVRNPEDVDWPDVAPRLARAGLNTVLPNYVRGLRAAYDSRVLDPVPPGMTSGALKTCIAECRRAGLEVHVWWTLLFLDDTSPAQVRSLEREGRVVRDPDGEVVGAPGGAWLCPSSEKNLALLRAAARELANAYELDGIHLDYARFPGERSCFCERCREALGAVAEGEDWAGEFLPGGRRSEEFRRRRRELVAGAVAAVVRAAREGRPGLFSSAAVFPEVAVSRETLGQDWVLWAEMGLVDFVTPMDYTTDADELGRWVRGQARDAGGRIPVVAGLGLAAGRSRLDDPAELVLQIAAARQAGADGFAIFQLNPDFLSRHLRLLQRGPGREGAGVGPTGGPDVRWALPDGVEPGAVPADEHVDVRVAIRERTAAGIPVTAFGAAGPDGTATDAQAPPSVTLETASGRLIADLGTGPPRGVDVQLPFRAPPGPFRIALRGVVRTPGRPARTVAVRSPLYVGRTREELAAEAARERPAGRGPRVAVLAGGYGSRGMLAALRRSGRFAAYPLRDCRDIARDGHPSPAVVVIPQRRAAGGLDAAAREAVRRFARRGGGVLLTHDACGYRYHAPVFPEIAAGTGRETSFAVSPEPGAPLAEAIGTAVVAHAHYDHIILAPGPDGVVAAKGEAGPVIVVGAFGRGRVVACGAAVGIDFRERERPPQGREAEMLTALVEWLAGAGADVRGPAEQETE